MSRTDSNGNEKQYDNYIYIFRIKDDRSFTFALIRIVEIFQFYDMFFSTPNGKNPAPGWVYKLEDKINTEDQILRKKIKEYIKENPERKKQVDKKLMRILKDKRLEYLVDEIYK